MSDKKQKEALLLAGKLAIASEIVLNSSIYSIAGGFKNLSKALNEYNDYIVEWALNKDDEDEDDEDKKIGDNGVVPHCPVSGSGTLCTIKECKDQFDTDQRESCRNSSK